MYDARVALAEARNLGWVVVLREEPLDAIRANWKSAFERKTWSTRHYVTAPDLPAVQDHEKLVRRLGSIYLNVDWSDPWDGKPPRLPDRNKPFPWVIVGGYEKPIVALAHFDDLGALRDRLGFMDTPTIGVFDTLSPEHWNQLWQMRSEWQLEIVNQTWRSAKNTLETLGEASEVKGMSIQNCDGVENCNVFRRLPQIKYLALSNCRTLSSLEGLETLGELRDLTLSGCAKLTDLAPLKNAPLYRLSISGAKELTDVEVLHKINLRDINFEDCPKVPKEEIEKLQKAALRNRMSDQRK